MPNFNLLNNIHKNYLKSIFNYTNTIYLVSGTSALFFTKNSVKAYYADVYSALGFTALIFTTNLARSIYKQYEVYQAGKNIDIEGSDNLTKSIDERNEFIRGNLFHKYFLMNFLPYGCALLGLHISLGKAYERGISSSNLLRVAGEIFMCLALKCVDIHKRNILSGEIKRIIESKGFQDRLKDNLEELLQDKTISTLLNKLETNSQNALNNVITNKKLNDIADNLLNLSKEEVNQELKKAINIKHINTILKRYIDTINLSKYIPENDLASYEKSFNKIRDLKWLNIFLEPQTTLFLLSGVTSLILSAKFNVDKANFTYYVFDWVFALPLVAYLWYDKYHKLNNDLTSIQKHKNVVASIVSDPFNINSTISTGLGMCAMFYKVGKNGITEDNIAAGLLVRSMAVFGASVLYLLANVINADKNNDLIVLNFFRNMFNKCISNDNRSGVSITEIMEIEAQTLDNNSNSPNDIESQGNVNDKQSAVSISGDNGNRKIDDESIHSSTRFTSPLCIERLFLNDNSKEKLDHNNATVQQKCSTSKISEVVLSI